MLVTVDVVWAKAPENPATDNAASKKSLLRLFFIGFYGLEVGWCQPPYLLIGQNKQNKSHRMETNFSGRPSIGAQMGIFYLFKTHMNPKILNNQMIFLPMLAAWAASRFLSPALFMAFVPIVLVVAVAAFTARVYCREGRETAVSYAAGASLFIGFGYVISLCL
jgi:hypothetical protein